MTELATANEDFPKLSEKKVRLLEESDLAEVEKKIEEFENNQNTFSGWKYAGQTRLDAALNMARVQCRKAEREMAALNETEKLPRPLPLKYINRLSDLFFVMARHELQSQNWQEEKWQKFAYKRRLKQDKNRQD